MQYRGGGGGMNEIVRQAARMQRKIEQARAEIKDQEVSFAAAGDKVRAVVTCERKVKRLEVDAAFWQAEGAELALDALAAAVNGALEAADKKVDEHLSKVTGGAKVPGLF